MRPVPSTQIAINAENITEFCQRTTLMHLDVSSMMSVMNLNIVPSHVTI